MTGTDSHQSNTELLAKAGSNIILKAESAAIAIMALVFLLGAIGKLPL